MRSSSVVAPNATPEIRSSKTIYALMVIVRLYSFIDTRRYENVRSIIVDLTLLLRKMLLTAHYCTTSRLVTTNGLPSAVLPLIRTKYVPRATSSGFNAHFHSGCCGWL